ncbi:MAG: hypothetical protein IPP99_00100 [Chitinophagaceae bacterium]|nr:hypothetical protein [Chitinophagaceae bacterium]
MQDSLPFLTLSSFGTTTVNSHEVEINFQISNRTNSLNCTASTNTWLYIPVNSFLRNITLTSQTAGCPLYGSTFSADSNNFFELGLIECKNPGGRICDYLLKANYDSCLGVGHHSLPVSYGWYCGAYPNTQPRYPADLSSDICSHYPQQMINVDERGVQLAEYNDSLFQQPATFALCNSYQFEACVESDGAGVRDFIAQIYLHDSLLILDTNSVFLVYNHGTSSTQVSVDSVGSSHYQVDLSAYDSLLNSSTQELANGEWICLRYAVTPVCGYSNSRMPEVRFGGVSFCGGVIPDSLSISTFNWTADGDSCSSYCQGNYYITINPVQPRCSGSVATISTSITGGIAPYSYDWNTGDSLSSIIVSPTVTSIYTVTVTDANGLSVTQTVTVNVLPYVNCCVPSGFDFNSDYNFSNIHSSSLGYDSITTQNIILINDTFTVDHDFAFRSCTNIVMGPNAVINILTGINFILYDSHVYSCNQMSQGLLSQRTSFVTIFGSTIENAIYGIQANDGTYLDVNQAVFNNDYIGIYCPTDSASGSTIVYGHVINSTFSCTGTLHLTTPYPKPMPLNFSKTFTGIYLEDNAFFDIGSGSTYPNIFEGLNNGVRAMRSNVNVERSRFLRIQNYDNITFGNGTGVSSAFCNGSGVYVNGISGYSALTQRGLDNPALNDFVDCNYAVVAFASNVKSSKNYVFNCDWGIRAAWSRNNDVLILENHLDCNKYGIVLQFTDGTLHTSVYHNEIDIGSRHALNGSASISGRGIYIWENQGANPSSSIERNNVSLHNYAKNGIEITGANNYLIDHNSVQMGVHSSNLKGIVLHLSDYNTLSCNNVYGLNSSYTNPSESAMEFWDSKSNVINCNSFDNTFNGLVFVANCAGGSGNETVVRANDFNDHYNGLFYSGSAHVDEQICRGNWWWKDVYAGFAAQNLDSAAAPFEQVFVDSSGQTFSNGANHTNFPDTLEINPRDWFRLRAQIDDSCNIDTTHHSECSLIPYYSKESSNLYLDILAAQGQIESSEFDEETKWKARVALYEKLLKQPEYLDSSQYLADFYINMAGTMIQHIAKVNVEHETLFSNQETVSTIVEQNSFQIYTQSEMIRLCDSLLTIDSLTNQIRDSLKFQVQNLRSSIANLIYYNLAALQSIDSTITINADLLNTANEEIVSNKIYEINQGIVNEIRIKCTEIIRPDSLQPYTSELISMAEQCPLSGGPAVYLARSLYSWLNLDVEYNDAQICIQNGLVLRKRNDSFLPEFIVFPNPAENELNLKYTVEDDVKFELIDQLGAGFTFRNTS